MAFNAGPSRGFNPRGIQRPAGPTQRPMGMAGPRPQPMPSPMMGRGMGMPFDRPQPQPVGNPMLGPQQPQIPPPMMAQPQPVGPPMMGPIDAGPSYMNPPTVNIPNMNIGQNMRGGAGLRGMYGGGGEELSNRPFRKQLFY